MTLELSIEEKGMCFPYNLFPTCWNLHTIAGSETAILVLGVEGYCALCHLLLNLILINRGVP